MPLKQWVKSANFAIEGVLHAAQTQRHLRYHFYAAGIVILVSYTIGVSRVEFLLLTLAVMAVISAEMLNTSVEALVDLLSPEHHERARQAKDMAAGAVLITAFGSAVLGYIVLLPRLSNFFHTGMKVLPRPSEELAVLSVTMVVIVVVLLKAYFGKGHPLSGGMPSGHSAVAFSLWVSVTFATGSLIASGLCFALAALLAQGRVSAGVHKPSEVLVCALTGALVTYLIYRVFSL